MSDTLKVPGNLYASSLPVPRRVNALAFAAATAESYTPTADTDFILISGTGGFYIRVGGTAAAPGDTTDGTASLYIPSAAQFVVEQGVAISIIPTAAAVITIAEYSK